MTQLSKLCCTRRFDPDLERRVKPATLSIYKKALAKLFLFLDECHLRPEGAESWDEALICYKQSRAISRGNFTFAVAAVEFFFPRFKRQMIVSRAVLEGMQVSKPSVHKVPMTKKPAILYACHFSSDGEARLGAALIIQTASGTRPSEILRLKPENVLFHETLRGPAATLRLGAMVSTKARREQTAPVYFSEDPEAYELLCSLCATTPIGSMLFPFSYAYYNSRIQQLSKQLKVGVLFSGHSPRAGFASERIARGEDRGEVQTRGRWLTTSSFQIYVDITLAAQVDTEFKLRGLQQATDHCVAHWQTYFPAVALAHAAVRTRPFTSSAQAVRHTRTSTRRLSSTRPAAQADYTVPEVSAAGTAIFRDHAAASQGTSQISGAQASQRFSAASGGHRAAAGQPTSAAKSRVRPPREA